MTQFDEYMKLFQWPTGGGYLKGKEGRFLWRRDDGSVGLLGLYTAPESLPLGKWTELACVCREGASMEIIIDGRWNC